MVESVRISDENITKMLDYGYQYNAVGVLNTNWGDLGHPCSLELSMHGLVLGAAKSWNKNTASDDEFNNSINAIEYKNKEAVKYLYMLDEAHKNLSWNMLAFCYSNFIHENKFDITYPSEKQIEEAISICTTIMTELSAQNWEREEYKAEMLLSAEGFIVIAELFAKLAGYKIKLVSNTERWLKEYRKSWLRANKESELSEIEKMFITLERA